MKFILDLSGTNRQYQMLTLYLDCNTNKIFLVRSKLFQNF